MTRRCQGARSENWWVGHDGCGATWSVEIQGIGAMGPFAAQMGLTIPTLDTIRVNTLVASVRNRPAVRASGGHVDLAPGPGGLGPPRIHLPVALPDPRVVGAALAGFRLAPRPSTLPGRAMQTQHLSITWLADTAPDDATLEITAVWSRTGPQTVVWRIEAGLGMMRGVLRRAPAVVRLAGSAA